jgi:hypothetical protein
VSDFYEQAAEQIIGREGETATFLLCLGDKFQQTGQQF